MSLKVKDLNPGDSRAVYKNLDFDMRQYKKLKMYIHAESIEGSSDLPGTGLDEEYDRRLVGFLRIGSDFSENYYQIEVPLKPTEYKKGTTNRLSSEAVWEPESNSIDFLLEKLTKLKALTLDGGVNSINTVYFDENLEIIDEFAPFLHYRETKNINLLSKEIRQLVV